MLLVRYKGYFFVTRKEDADKLASLRVPLTRIPESAGPLFGQLLRSKGEAAHVQEWREFWPTLVERLAKSDPRAKFKGEKILLYADNVEALQTKIEKLRRYFARFSLKVEFQIKDKGTLAAAQLSLVFDENLPHGPFLYQALPDDTSPKEIQFGGSFALVVNPILHQKLVQFSLNTLDSRSNHSDVLWSRDLPLNDSTRAAMREFVASLLPLC